MIRGSCVVDNCTHNLLLIINFAAYVLYMLLHQGLKCDLFSMHIATYVCNYKALNSRSKKTICKQMLRCQWIISLDLTLNELKCALLFMRSNYCILSGWIKGFCCTILAIQHRSVLFGHTTVMYESYDSCSTASHVHDLAQPLLCWVTCCSYTSEDLNLSLLLTEW